MNDLKYFFDMTNDINFINIVRYNDVYFSCIKEKQIRKLSRQSQILVIELLKWIDSNVSDFISSQSLKRKKYFVLYTDRVFDACWDYLMTRKSEVFDIFTKTFQSIIENQCKNRIKRRRINHDTKIKNKQMNIWSKKHNIKSKLFALYSLKQNNISKHQNRTIVQKIKAMLVDVDLFSNIWEKIFFTSIYLRNRLSTSRLRFCNINNIFYKIWTNKKLDLRHLDIIEYDV